MPRELLKFPVAGCQQLSQVEFQIDPYENQAQSRQFLKNEGKRSGIHPSGETVRQ